MRIVYFCTSPGPGEHAGGVRVIYDHCHALNDMGIETFVLHHRRGYEYPWAERSARTISDDELGPADHLVLPEIKAAALARRLAAAGVSYSVFVQNGYYLRDRDRGSCDADIDFAYSNATSILSISSDTSALLELHYPHLARRIVGVSCTVNQHEFRAGGEKKPVITYMPRKNGPHAAAVVFALQKRLPPGWQVRAIDGMSEQEVAGALRESRIFMSFSGLEGLGLPPIEAAMCGNYVIGYHGGGGREYWVAPNFEPVEAGDIASFVRKVTACAESIDGGRDASGLIPGITALQERYSAANERAGLQRFIEAIALDAPARAAARPRGSASLKLQMRPSLRWWLGTWNARRPGQLARFAASGALFPPRRRA